MMPCREVAHLLASDEWRSAPPMRRLQLRFHLWMCGDCRRYRDQLSAMGSAARDLFGDASGDQGTIDRLKNSLLDDDEDRDG